MNKNGIRYLLLNVSKYLFCYILEEVIYIYFKSPLNYTGGKYKLLPQLLPLFPKDITVFYDLFTGGGDIAVNIKANKIIANDISYSVIDLLSNLKSVDSEEALNIMNDTIKKFRLSKENKEGYLNLRDYYNKSNKNYYVFYALITNITKEVLVTNY